MKHEVIKILCDMDNGLLHGEGSRLLTVTKWDDADPVIDLRDWTVEDGELIPEEGISLDWDGVVLLVRALIDYVIRTADAGRREGDHDDA